MSKSERLVWLDLEMTGLNPDSERIIEIAACVTEGDLSLIAKGPDIVIHQDDELLAKMDEWNTKHHGESGLTDQVKASTINEAKAEEELLAFIREYCPKGKCPLAGNSIHQDRRFLSRYMPTLDDYLHYRLVDVSSIKELVKRWLPSQYSKRPQKKASHRALDDILESIEELKFYKENIFIKS